MHASTAEHLTSEMGPLWHGESSPKKCLLPLGLGYNASDGSQSSSSNARAFLTGYPNYCDFLMQTRVEGNPQVCPDCQFFRKDSANA